MNISPSAVHNKAFITEMKPAYIGLHYADKARIQIRQQAVNAIDYAIQQIHLIKSLPRGNPDWPTSFDPLDLHLTHLTKVARNVKRAPLQTRLEAKTLSKLVCDLIASTPECQPTVRTVLGLKAQQLKMTCKKFHCYIKDLPETIARVSAGTHPLPIKLSIAARFKQLLARIYHLVASIFGIPKPIDRITFDELLQRTKDAEEVVRKRIALMDPSGSPNSPNMTLVLPSTKAFTEAASPQKYTFGDVLRYVRHHVGTATATFLRAFIEEHLPYDEDVADLDPIFNVIAEVINKSSYRSLDVILDENARLENTLERQLLGKWSAEAGKASISVAEKLLEMIPADQDITPAYKARLLKDFKSQFTTELAKLHAIPNSATLDQIRSIHDASIIVCFIADIIGGIQGARKLHQRILTGEINRPPQDTDSYSVLALTISKINLDRLWWVDNGLWLATQLRIRPIITKFFALFQKVEWIQKRVFKLLSLDNSLTEDQRQRIVDTVPNALKILDKVDFRSPQNQLAKELFFNILDVIKKGVEKPKPQAPKQLAIQLTQAFSQLIHQVITSERSFAAGVQAVVNLGRPSPPSITH